MPGVETAWGDAERAADRSNRIHGLIRRYEPEDLLGFVSASLANQAVAFDRISRSSLSCLFSRRSFTSSSRSALVNRSLRLPLSASACASQLRIVCSEGSNSSASSFTLRPDRTRSTIFWRNSNGYGCLVLRIPGLPHFPKIEVSTKAGQLHFVLKLWE